MKEGALTSFTVCDAYRYSAWLSTVIDVTKKVTQRIFNIKG